MKAINKAIREASSENRAGEGAYGDITTPATTGEKVGKALTERRETQSAEGDKKDTGEGKDEQL